MAVRPALPSFVSGAIRCAGIGAVLACTAGSAGAHYLWLEPAGNTARLFFGEVNEVREQSPGRLDEMPQPVARRVPDGKEVAFVRGRTAFALPAGAGTRWVAVEAGYPVKDWTKQGIGVVKPVFSARLSDWPLATALPPAPGIDLDVQPVPASRDTVQVLFQGRPLAGARLVVHAPNGWDQEHKADGEGKVRVLLPWRGQYVLEVLHRDAVAGEFQGQRYEAVRHRATLTIVRRDGRSPAGTGQVAPYVAER